VWVTFSDGLRYAVPVDRWSPTEILARVPDLNHGRALRLAVRTPQSMSNPWPLEWQSQVLAPEELRRIDPTSAVLFEHASDLKVGNQGDVQHAVGVPTPVCGRRVWIFDHAELRHLRQRFGEAQIVSQPRRPCVECEPIRVRWYHEPTGNVHFQVRIFRRAVEGVCTDRVR
jgi:hypothetical protein